MKDFYCENRPMTSYKKSWVFNIKMLWLLAHLQIFALILEACKRTLSDVTGPSVKRMRLNPVDSLVEGARPENQPISQFNMPDDIVAHMISAHLPFYRPLPMDKSPPLCHLALVSKQWNKAFHSNYHKACMRLSPGSAHWLLKQDLRLVSRTHNWDIFITSIDELNDFERLEILMTTSDLEVLRELCRLPKWDILDTGSHRRALARLLDDNIITLDSFDAIRAQTDSVSLRLFMEVPFRRSAKAHPTNHILFKLPQEDLIKLIFLDNLVDPGDFSFINVFITEEITCMYHKYPEYHSEITSWIARLDHIVLPKYQQSLVADLFQWTMILAILAGDRKIFPVLSIDFEHAIKSVQQSPLMALYTNFRDFASGSVDFIDPNLKEVLADCIDKRIMGRFMGFKPELIVRGFSRLINWYESVHDHHTIALIETNITVL